MKRQEGAFLNNDVQEQRFSTKIVSLDIMWEPKGMVTPIQSLIGEMLKKHPFLQKKIPELESLIKAYKGRAYKILKAFSNLLDEGLVDERNFQTTINDLIARSGRGSQWL